jgi:ribosomal protein L16 Arg81 hydroxylase
MDTQLADLLHPVSTETFVRQYWTKLFLHVPGAVDKFAHLYSWEVLNRALQELRFGQLRLSVVRAGRALDPARYLAHVPGQVHAERLTREFAQGATIILNNCEEVHLPLRGLCAGLERMFHVPVSANLYAACRTDNGFDVHWDEQDTLILQIYGRKHWKVWAPTRQSPLTDDVVDTSAATKPGGPPLWDGILEQGGMLSLPRGWWHLASPLGAPSLHVTVTIKNVTGIDLLRWLAEQMKGSATARMSLPAVDDANARHMWLDALWKDLSASWHQDLIERYLADCDRRLIPRPSLRLPEEPAAIPSATREQPRRSPLAAVRDVFGRGARPR